MPQRKSSSDNGMGLMIIIAILGVAVVKAFDIEFSIANLKLLGVAGMGIIIAILYFFGAQGKKNYDENHYKSPEPTPEEQPDDRYANNNQYDAPNPYDQTSDNRYGNQSYGNYNNYNNDNNDNQDGRW